MRVSPSTSSNDIKVINNTVFNTPERYSGGDPVIWIDIQSITTSIALDGTYTFRVYYNMPNPHTTYFAIAMNGSCFVGCGQSWHIEPTTSYVAYYINASTHIPAGTTFQLSIYRWVAGDPGQTLNTANFSLIYTSSIPTVPTISAPVNSTQYNNPVQFAWSTSTDTDGGTIYYNYQVSSASDFSTLLYNSTTTDTSLNLSLIDNIYYVRVRSYDGDYYSPWSGSVNFTVNKPILYTPANLSTQTKAYPPLTSNIVFTWSSGGDYTSNLLVAKDSNFNLIVVDTVVTTNYSTQSLEAGDYWWGVRYYNVTGLTYYNYSAIFNFTLSNQQTISGTNIQGTVYEVIAGTFTPISNARVFISNNESTLSYDMVTGSNGYFLFSGLTNSTTYNLRATRTDLYQNSVLYYVTTGAGTTTTQNILMEKCTSSQDCYFGTIDQSIMFQSYNATTHVTSFLSGYTVNIYEDGAVVPLYTLTTDQYGVVVVRLTTTKRYQVSIHNGDGVNMITNVADRNIYPRGEGIVITIETGTDAVITYPTNTTVTNTTERHGSTGCGISCYNSSYLTSTTGIGALGQGVLTSLVVWIVYGAGGAVTVMFTVGILAWLGIISWYMVFLFVVTGMSIYVLKEM